MVLGSFLRRHWVIALRRGEAFWGRTGTVVTMTIVLAVFVITWDWNGWDRASVLGARRFGHTAFGTGVSIVGMALTVGVAVLKARGIAKERDFRSMCRTFDAVVGRPTRPRTDHHQR